MPEPETPTPTNTAAVMGLDKPFPPKEAKGKDGVDSATGLFEGVHPEDKSRVSLTLAGLQAEFGKKLGEKKYLEIAGMQGGSVFFQPASEATSFRPPLGLTGLNAERRAIVDEILSAEE